MDVFITSATANAARLSSLHSRRAHATCYVPNSEHLGNLQMRSWRRRTAEEAAAIFSELALPREVLESGSFDLRRSRNNPFSIASDTLAAEFVFVNAVLSELLS